MDSSWTRTEMLLGEENVRKLAEARVAVFGLGGVGGYTVEALARSGIGHLDLVDNDTVNVSNLNRQILALRSTIGQYKTDAAKARVLDINPECGVEIRRTFFLPENADEFDFSRYDYVVDAVDTITAKIELILRAQAAGVPVISCMGAGNKLDPTAFRVADIYRTNVCPLAKVMRRELKKRGVKHLKVVYSEEPAPRMPADPDGQADGPGDPALTEPAAAETKGTCGRPAPGSIAFVPSVAGLILAGEVVRDLCGLGRS